MNVAPVSVNHALQFTSIPKWLDFTFGTDSITWNNVSAITLGPIANQQSTENTTASLNVQATG